MRSSSSLIKLINVKIFGQIFSLKRVSHMWLILYIEFIMQASKEKTESHTRTVFRAHKAQEHAISTCTDPLGPSTLLNLSHRFPHPQLRLLLLGSRLWRRPRRG